MARAEAKARVEVQKRVDIKEKMLLLLVRAFRALSISLFLPVGERLF